MQPFRPLEDLGTRLEFYWRAVAWMPRTVVRYRREIMRLLAEVLEHAERPVDGGLEGAQWARQRAGGGHQIAFCGMTWK